MSQILPSRPTKLILQGTPEELAGLVAQKVLYLATHFVEIPIESEIASTEDCKRGSPLARSLILFLVYEGDPNSDAGRSIPVATSRAMLKVVASMATSNLHSTKTIRSDLIGRSPVEEAVMDGWLNFFWASIELPLVMLSSSELGNDTEEQPRPIEQDLTIALKKVDQHLERTKIEEDSGVRYIVSSNGDSILTLADVSLAFTIHFMLEQDIPNFASIMNSDEIPNLRKWYQSLRTTLEFS